MVLSRVAFPVAPVARSAFRCGSLRGLSVRSSRRSFSGAVVVCSFSSRSSAVRFARLWAVRCGVGCVLRSSPSFFSVSVPFAGSGSSPVCCLVVGGLVGFHRALSLFPAV